MPAAFCIYSCLEEFDRLGPGKSYQRKQAMSRLRGVTLDRDRSVAGIARRSAEKFTKTPLAADPNQLRRPPMGNHVRRHPGRRVPDGHGVSHRPLQPRDAQITGIPREAIVGRNCCEMFSQRELCGHECLVTRVRQSRQRETTMVRFRGRLFAVAADPVLDEAGEFIGMVYTMSDVTAISEAEEAREAAQRELAAQRGAQHGRGPAKNAGRNGRRHRPRTQPAPGRGPRPGRTPAHRHGPRLGHPPRPSCGSGWP